MKTNLISLVIAGFFIIPVVFGQKPDPDRPNGGKNDRPDRPPKHFSKMWNKADSDQNGGLSRDEFSSLPRVALLSEEQRTRLFQRLDKDANGTIERSEMSRPNPGGADRKNRMKKLWELDMDQDGRISMDEFSNGEISQRLPEERKAKLFKRLDTNGDGFISKEDRPKRRDGDDSNRNPDGKGERAFPRQPRPDPGNFDTNRDGILDFAEFSGIPMFRGLDEDRREDAFEKLDRNGDLELSSDEWKSLASGGMPPWKKRKKMKGGKAEDDGQ